jgi:hypothetical protein
VLCNHQLVHGKLYSKQLALSSDSVSVLIKPPRLVLLRGRELAYSRESAD